MKLSQLTTLMNLQMRMNAAVNPDWVAARYPYLRAVIVEGGEAIEHHGWKWWKAQKMEIDQLRLELVDILHFYLSDFLIRAHYEQEAPADVLPERAAHLALAALASECAAESDLSFDGNRYIFSELDQISRLELMIGLAVSRRVSMRLLLDAWASTQPETAGDANPSEQLFFQYVGKNILNVFRQDHGYKQGTYIKIWKDGREDNEHLTEIMAGMSPADPDLEAQVIGALKDRYRQNIT